MEGPTLAKASGQISGRNLGRKRARAAEPGGEVIVNTVVIAKGRLALGDGDVASMLASFGAGSMLAALALPRLLERVGDRPVMLAAAAAMAGMLGAASLGAAVSPGATWTIVIVSWFALGIAYCAVLTPGGRLLRRSAHAQDR